MQRISNGLAGVALGLMIAVGWQLLSSGQQPAPEKAKDSGNRLEFEVVHSFDAKYLGDTPGHMGRAGGLSMRRPRIALGDPVYRGEEQVGLVTHLDWNRVNNGLDVEFDPIANARVCVGDSVWLVLDNPRPYKADPPQTAK
jgi:hypothetical protein